MEIVYLTKNSIEFKLENPEDAKKVIRQIQEKLAELEGKPAGKYFTDNQHAKGQELG